MSRWRWLLRLYPRQFRRERGDEILRSLDDELGDARRQGGLGGRFAALAAVLDVLWSALAEHARALRPPSPRTALAELRFAARGLRRSGRFTLVAAATLALPIGAATTVFSVVNGVMLKPLPYEASDRLVNIWNDLGQGAQSLPAVHPGDFKDYQRMSRTFEELAAAAGGPAAQATGVLTGDGPEPEQVDVSAVTANFFPLLGVMPFLGRQLTADDERPGGNRVVLLGHDLWRRRYGADPGVVGRSITMDGTRYTVAAVLPPGFHLRLPAEAFMVKDAQVWVPLRLDYAKLPPRNYTFLTVFGRLAPGVTLAQAQQEMDGIAARLRAEHPVHKASDLRIRVIQLHHDVVKGVGPILLMLMAAVGVVLLIGCANVAGLLLARAAQRRREMAVHAALGAGRGRLVIRLLAECLMIAAAGAAGGLLVTVVALNALSALLPSAVPRADEIGIDARVLAVAALITVGAAVLVSLLPALRSPEQDLSMELRTGARGSTPLKDRLRRTLVVGELALAIVLLTTTGLLTRSLLALRDVRPGFDAAPALTFRLSYPQARYPGGPERVAFTRTLLERLSALPGVEAAGAISQLPLTGSGPLSPYAYDERTAHNWESVTADGRQVSPTYFAAMGARFIAGRPFTETDTDKRVIIIDDQLARRVWPAGDAVGHSLQVGPLDDEHPYAEVVGVVEHLRMHDLTRPLLPQIYRPLSGGGAQVSFVLRVGGDPARLAPAVRETVRALDPGLAVSRLVPMSHYVEEASGQARLSALLMLLFGAQALLLSGIGVYGIVAYTVAQRTREYGIRLALGETPAALRRNVLGQGIRLGLPAVILGVGGAFFAARLLGRLLYDVTPADPLTYAATAAIVFATMVLASWVPAWRASRVDPAAALGAE